MPQGLQETWGTEVSRRRVLVGTAWATPAVLVGLAAPPAAASVPADPGALAVFGQSASRQILWLSGQINYTVRAAVTHAGGPETAPVSGIGLRVSMSSQRAGATPPAIAAASSANGWAYSATGTANGRRYWDCTYSGTLDASGDSTYELLITFTGPIVWTVPDTNVYFLPSGTSAGVSVVGTGAQDDSAS